MSTIHVDSLDFTFHPSMYASKYDESSHYLRVCQRQGLKAVDIVAMKMAANPDTVWLIEAKDFRVIRGDPKPSNIHGLAKATHIKVIDTLAGLSDAASDATDAEERLYAERATAGRRKRIVLHLEPHDGTHSKLFPRNFSGGVLQQLKQLVRSIDPNPLVLSISKTPRSRVPWTVG